MQGIGILKAGQTGVMSGGIGDYDRRSIKDDNQANEGTGQGFSVIWSNILEDGCQ